MIDSFLGGPAINLEGGGTNMIEGNWLGLQPGGLSASGNQYGIFIYQSCCNNIGGTNANQRNVISGNSTGVSLNSSSYNRLCGNFIGTDITGTNKVNNVRGIDLSTGTNNVIGGSLPGEGNVISGNHEFGVRLILGQANRVIGNLIGTDARGTGRFAE